MDKMQGRRGVITTHKENGRMIATKSAKDITKKGSINKESQILYYLKERDVDFVPHILSADDGAFSYDWISGDHLKKVYKRADYKERKQLALKLLERAYQLDQLGVVHGEMIRPFTNMLVDAQGKMRILDFERGKIGDTSGKNMRSLSQWLHSVGWLSFRQMKHLGNMSLDNMYQYLYKRVSEKRDLSMPKLILGGLFFVLIDQITKYVFYNIAYAQDTWLITPMLNTGIAWSIPVPLLLLIIGTIGILGAVWRAFKKDYLPWHISVLIIAGGTGNLLDRVFYQGVRDFIDLHVRPIFNFADMYLTIGALILLYYVFFRHEEVL